MSRSKERQHRVWLEIEKHNDDEINVYRAAVLSGLLKKLGYDCGSHAPIFWFEKKQTFCVTIDVAGSFKELADNGHWFSLERLADAANGAKELRDVNYVLSLAVRFLARAKAQGYKGKTADKAAIEFFCGALSVLEIAGMKEAFNHVSTFAALVLTTRGIQELEKIAANKAEAA